MALKYSRYVYTACFIVPVLFNIMLLVPFSRNRGTVIPLTFRTCFNEWGALRTLYETAPLPLMWQNISAIIWCPLGSDTSPQCRCFRDYFEFTYLPDAQNKSFTRQQLGEKHGRGAVMDCLRFRPSWRKETCGQFCRLHVSTPVILFCLYMLFFFAKLIERKNSFMGIAAQLLPPALALITIITQLAIENVGGILSSLSVISSYMESIYVSRDDVTLEQVFWSYHRYLCGAMAVWAAVTHQARDVYQVIMYGVSGFTAGLLAYMVFLIKSGRPCRRNQQICITVWLGICAVAGMFMIVIQQHWYAQSTQASSMASVVCLFICIFQCLFQTPYDVAPVSLHVLLSLTVLFISFWAVVSDTWEGVS
jgi:hypothetical protein